MLILATELSWTDPFSILMMLLLVIGFAVLVSLFTSRTDARVERRIRRKAWSWAEQGGPDFPLFDRAVKVRNTIKHETQLDPDGKLWWWSCPWCGARFEARSELVVFERGTTHILEAVCDPSVEEK